jgi:phage portal protein BeeE
MIGIQDQKYNNTQTLLDEFYKSTMYPTIVNVQEKLKQQLFQGYPSLCIQFDTANFLKGAPLDQMNYVKAGVEAGILTPNEAREYLGKAQKDGGDELKKDAKSSDPIPGSSPQDTGGSGGNQRSRMNIGKN